MKGAEAYVNDQWNSSGLADLPQGTDSQCVTLRFVISRDEQYTGLIEHICKVAQRHLCEAYPGRDVTPEPVQGSVVSDGTGDGIELVFNISAAH